jgi:glycosyltransferase involved in cell wall biosynthesis
MYTHRALGLYQHGVDLYVAPSLFLRHKLVQGGIRRTPIFHLPNAIDASQYVPHYGGQDCCVYFGRLSPEKGVDTLIRSMRGQQDLKLSIIGDGLQRRELEDLARSEKLDNVEFLGALYGEDLKHVVAKALFVVLPSRCYENCPFSILESFAMGKPVIGSNIGGIPELISPGRDGWLAEPGDVENLRSQMRRLVTDRESAIEMGRRARAKIEDKYSVEKHQQGLMKAYQRVMSRSISCSARDDGEEG